MLTVARFDVAIQQEVGAILVIGNSLMQPHKKLVVDLAAQYRLPTMYPAREFVDAGGLMSHGLDYFQLFYRAATLVEKIRKGAKPADMPVEQPTKFELVVSLRAAKVLGLSMPQTVLLRADEVIQ